MSTFAAYFYVAKCLWKKKINNNINDSTLLDLIYDDNSQVARKAGKMKGEGGWCR